MAAYRMRLRNGVWYVRAMLTHSDGSKERKEVTTGYPEAEKKKAELAAVKIVAEFTERKTPRAKGAANSKDFVVTFADWWEVYRRDFEPDKAAGTQAYHRSVMKHWLPILGDMELAAITEADLRAAMRRRRQSKTTYAHREHNAQVKPGTINRERRLIQALFNKAVDEKHISANPWKGIKREKDKGRPDRLLTEEDQVKLFAAMQTPRRNARGNITRVNERYVRFVEFMIETGLRIEELLGRKGGDAPRPPMKDHGGYVTVIGKSRDREGKPRDVPLTAKARKVLDEQWADAKAEGFKQPWWQSSNRFRNMLMRMAKRAEIDHLSPHDLRHSFGHRWLVKGGDIYTLSLILGHSEVGVTQKHYAYLSRTDLAAAMKRVMEPTTV